MLTGNYYPITEQFKISKGSNTHDFKVTPYARVTDVKISYDASTKELVARVKVAHGDASKTNGISVFFMGAQDRFVGKNHNNFTDATASAKYVEPGQEVELRVNPNEVYNYSAVYKVSEDFGTITEVTDWE